MKTLFKTAIAAASLLVLGGVVVYAAEVYNYKCDKCGLILTFDKSNDGVKCPKDGTRMWRKYK